MATQFEKKKLMQHATRIAFLVLFLAALVFTFFTPAFAQDGVPTDDEVNAIARKLYCPVCESTPLDVCPTEACKDWREQIRTMLADGKSEEEILEYFEAQYGARVLAEPPKKGFYWLVYLLPPVLILAGAIILFRSLKAWTRPGVEPAGPGESGSGSPSQSDDYIARLEEELKKQK